MSSGRRRLGDDYAAPPCELVPEAHSIERRDEMSLRELEAHSLRLLSAEVQRLSGGGKAGGGGGGWSPREGGISGKGAVVKWTVPFTPPPSSASRHTPPPSNTSQISQNDVVVRNLDHSRNSVGSQGEAIEWKALWLEADQRARDAAER
jgi:hypothetical protein